MRRVTAFPCLLVLLLGAPADAIPFTGRLDVVLGGAPAVSITGSGEGVSTPTSVSITSGGITGTRIVPLTSFPSIFPLVEVRLEGAGLGAASFSAGAGPQGGFGGDAALGGVARIGLFGPPAFAFLTVPLGVAGVEGALTAVSSPLGVEITAAGGGWTTGAALVPGFTSTALAGTDLRTPDGLGTLVLVSPTVARTNVAGSETVPVYARLSLDFGSSPAPPDPGEVDPPEVVDPGVVVDDVPVVIDAGDGRVYTSSGGVTAVPEPGALLLFGAGWLALAAGLRRHRR